MRYQAYFASVFVTSSVVGPVIGGFFAQDLHWSLIFWINLPLGLLALAMTYGVLKRLPRHERPHKLDVIGALLMAVAATTLLLALSWGGSTYPWTSLAGDRPSGVSVVAWGLFAARLLTAPEPFVPLAVMFNPVVGTGTAANFFVVGTMVGLSIFVPIYFEAVVGLTASQSGLALIALMGGTVTGAQIAGRIMAWSDHYKRGPLAGLLVAVVGAALLAVRSGAHAALGDRGAARRHRHRHGHHLPGDHGCRSRTRSSRTSSAPRRRPSTSSARSAAPSWSPPSARSSWAGSASSGAQSTSLQALVADAAANGTPIGPVFSMIFAAAAVTLAVGFVCFLAMEERPLKGRAGT